MIKLSLLLSLLLVLTSVWASSQAQAQTPGHAPTRIAIVGDSTVANYKLTDPHRGWGQMLPEFFDTTRVVIQNFARNGRSTKTFLQEGLWDKALAFHPDYVLIQFGHNDSHGPGHPEATDANTDYMQYLREYVDTARAQGAFPILVTPMHRGLWDKSQTHLTLELQPYADAMKRVAAEKHVPVIDLFTLSGDAYEKLGPQRLVSIFAIPSKDRTHFNAGGARMLAGIVAVQLAQQVPALRPVIHLKAAEAAANPANLPVMAAGGASAVPLSAPANAMDDGGTSNSISPGK